MPTRNSRIVVRLAYEDDFTIFGYVGDDSDGSRWYYVRTSIDSGNQLGYIHSSSIMIGTDVDDH